MAKDRLFNPREAAEYIGLQEQTLAVWRMDGKNLDYIKVGRSVKYRQSTLEEYLKRQTICAS